MENFFFTIMIPCFSLMLAFKIPNKTQDEIIKRLDTLEEELGRFFYVLFDKVIPDNGVEFLDFLRLERSIHEGITRLKVYYTHTYASYEKPHVENNHILLRWLIYKKYDITQLTADDIICIINRLNNYPRPKKNYKTPIQLLENTFTEKFGKTNILEILNLHHIPISELNMKDMIIKNKGE